MLPCEVRFLNFRISCLLLISPAVSATSQRKQPHEDSNTCGGSSLGGSTLTTPTGTWTSTSSNSTRWTNQSVVHPNPNPKNHHHQLKLYGNAIIPEATQQMHIAIDTFIHGSALPFNMARDPNFLNIIQIVRNLGPRYSPPDRQSVSRHLLNLLYDESFKEMMRSFRG
jgi:hypothetical protein